jgi:histidinol dehydrogenase
MQSALDYSEFAGAGGISAERWELSADFVKSISVQETGVAGFQNLSNDVETPANAKGLPARAGAVEVRK